MQPILASTSLFQAYLSSDTFGKLIFLALFALSGISWIILLYKIWQSYRVKRLSEQFRSISQKGTCNFFALDQNLSLHLTHPSNAFLDIYRMLKKYSLEILQKNQKFLEKKGVEGDVYLSISDVGFIDTQLQSTIYIHKNSLEKYLFILSTVVSLAPFLGLLGTVWGILITFADLQGTQMGGSQGVILGGLSMALATTVLGLLIAIPALIAYNYLKTLVNDFEMEMENFTNQLLATLEMLYRKVDIH